MHRTCNFNAGPAALPIDVLQEAQQEFLDYRQTGMSILEISHRSEEYADMHAETKKLLRSLMHIPADYEILFLQGGGSTQFFYDCGQFPHAKIRGLHQHRCLGSKSYAGSKIFRRSL